MNERTDNLVLTFLDTVLLGTLVIWILVLGSYTLGALVIMVFCGGALCRAGTLCGEGVLVEGTRIQKMLQEPAIEDLSNNPANLPLLDFQEEP